MDKELLELLVCVSCKSPLKYSEHNKNLVCKRCGMQYPIIEDIPLME